MEANADVKTFQQIIRILPETSFALLTQGVCSMYKCWQHHWGLHKHLDLQAIFYLQKNQIIIMLQSTSHVCNQIQTEWDEAGRSTAHVYRRGAEQVNRVW